jgi:putative two-component system response regulator
MAIPTRTPAPLSDDRDLLPRASSGESPHAPGADSADSADSAPQRSAPAGQPPKRLLLVDDEPAVLASLSRFLGLRGYDVRTATSGAAALELLRGARFAAMVCDVRMPGMSGLETVPRALALDPDLAVLMLTGVNDAPTATEALARGAADYLTKPVELPDLQHAVERALHRRELAIERRRVEELIRQEVALRTEELEREKATLRSLTVSIAEALINAMEAKDVYLRGHSQRVAELAASMANALGLDDDTVEHVRLAGRLHDVGQIGIRESVLHKPGALEPEEFEHVKDHVRIGLEILAPLDALGVVLDYVRDHHEHWDGSGYPRGRRGGDISIGGRVLAAADAFDALTSKRAYREPMAPEQVIEYLGANHVGRLLDPAVYGALKAVVVGRKTLTLTFIDDLHS